MIHPTAIIGEPPEHRDFRHKQCPPTYASIFFQPLIDETATIEALVTVDAGAFRYTAVGARSWLMKNVHVGHDTIIGSDCEIAPLTSVGGECELGNGVKVGQGATFKPRVKVGDGAVIGMGAVVTKDVPAGETWVGNPARKLDPKPKAGRTSFNSNVMPRRFGAGGTPKPKEAAGWEAFVPEELPIQVADTLADDLAYGAAWDRSRAR